MTLDEAYRQIKASYIHHSQERNAVLLPQAELIAMECIEKCKQADVQPVSKWMSDLCIVCGRDVRKDSTYYDINGATVCEGCMGVSCKVEKEG